MGAYSSSWFCFCFFAAGASLLVLFAMRAAADLDWLSRVFTTRRSAPSLLGASSPLSKAASWDSPRLWFPSRRAQNTRSYSEYRRLRCWGLVWSSEYTNNARTTREHRTNTVRTPYGQRANTVRTPYGHRTNTVRTPYGQRGGRCKYILNGI